MYVFYLDFGNLHVHHVVTVYTRNMSMKVRKKVHEALEPCLGTRPGKETGEVYAKGSRTRMEEEEWEREGETGSGTTHSSVVAY